MGMDENNGNIENNEIIGNNEITGNNEKPESNEKTDSNEDRKDMIRVWKKRKDWILFWSIIAVALLIAILFQNSGQ